MASQVIPLKDSSHLSTERTLERLSAYACIFNTWPDPCTHYRKLNHRETSGGEDTWVLQHSWRESMEQLPAGHVPRTSLKAGSLSWLSSSLLVLSLLVENITSHFRVTECIHFLNMTDRGKSQCTSNCCIVLMLQGLWLKWKDLLLGIWSQMGVLTQGSMFIST